MCEVIATFYEFDRCYILHLDVAGKSHNQSEVGPGIQYGSCAMP